MIFSVGKMALFRYLLENPARTIGVQVRQMSSDATKTPVISKSRRNRRLKRRQAATTVDTRDTSSFLQDLKENVQLVSQIDSLSKTGLTERVEIPKELVDRVVSINKRRTHSQLETIKEKYVTNENERRGFPLDMHKHPIGWTLDKEPQIKEYLYGATETLGYIAYEMESSYASIHQVFHQLQLNNPDFQPQSMLDFGAGPGTASWVAKSFYDDSLSKYRVVEPSQSMVDVCEILMNDFPGLSIRRKITEMKREIEKGFKYDLIVASYVLSDITNDYERIVITTALWELLSDKGCLVLVDRGSSWGSFQIRSARQFILDSVLFDDDTEDIARILAPCPHHFECPAAGNTWCHFVQRAPRTIYPRDASTKRWHGNKGSKFSYVVVEKNGQDPNEQKQSLARMIRGPLLATRHVHLDLCTPSGELERRAVTKGRAIREVYRAARKSHWGGAWPADATIYMENNHNKKKK